MGNWKHKHENFKKALSKLEQAANRMDDDLQLQDGLIQPIHY